MQNNFSIEDVLAYYKNKLIHRWLDVRGYEKELEAVNAITEENNIEVIKRLISIFGIEVDNKKVAESIYALEYLYERNELFSIYKQDDFKVKSILNDYQTGYFQLISSILTNKDDICIIKSALYEIDMNYRWVFKLNHRHLFYTFEKEAPMAIFCMLMNENIRQYYLPNEALTQNEEENKDKLEMHKKICSLFQDESDDVKQSSSFNARTLTYSFEMENTSKTSVLNAILADNLKLFSGVTDNYWKDLESKEKKYMILSIGKGDYVRSSGKTGEEFGYTDVNNKFIIVDGIDYKSNSSARSILYMEV